jgi:hypothetical protein
MSSTVWMWAYLLGSLALVALVMWLDRRRSRQALVAHAGLRGWQNLIHSSESIVPWTKPQGMWTAGANVGGTWKGLRAEIVRSQPGQLESQDRIMAAVACARVPQGLGWVTASKPTWPFSTRRWDGFARRSELGRRFRLSGEDRDLQAIFTPAVEKAILDFPRQIRQVMFDGKAASVTWYGPEEAPAIVDAALDLAVIIVRQVEAATTIASG